MSSFTDYTEQRLVYARDILKSGEIQRALSICEQLLSPASILSHGREIFQLIADAIELSGDAVKASVIRNRAEELFPESMQGEVSLIRSPDIVIEQLLPFIQFEHDPKIAQVEYDPVSIVFPDFEQSLVVSHIQNVRSEESLQTLSALEELAQRLEHARIPAIEEEKTIATPSFMPSIVTETMANIYVQQGAYSQAIKAYQVLARNHPEKLEQYETIIAELRSRQS